ncbi:MAG: radical SAM protein [Bacteroidota bacterium]
MPKILSDINKKYKLTNILIELNWNCNASCPHCFIPQNDAVYFMKHDDAIKYIEQAANMGVKEITFSGGEPFLNKDIIEILHYANTFDFENIYVLSNLSLITQAHILELVKIKFLTIQTTIFSTNSNIHDEIIGLKGSFSKTTETLQLLKSKGVNVQISCPLLKQNYNTFRELQKWADEQDYALYPNFDIVAKTNYEKNNIESALSNEQKVQLIKDLILIDKHPFWSKWKDTVSNYENTLTLFDAPCEAGVNQIVIHPNGEIAPCMLWNVEGVENLKQKSLESIWKNSPVLNKIRNTKLKDFNLTDTNLTKFVKVCFARNANLNNGNHLHISEIDFEYAELLDKMVTELNNSENV